MKKAQMMWCLSIGGVGKDRERVAQVCDGRRSCGRMLE